MKGMRYADVSAIQTACTILRTIPANDLVSSLEMLLSRANECIEAEGTILNKINQLCRKKHSLFLFSKSPIYFETECVLLIRA